MICLLLVICWGGGVDLVGVDVLGVFIGDWVLFGSVWLLSIRGFSSFK